jgi:hypothetical protein
LGFIDVLLGNSKQKLRLPSDLLKKMLKPMLEFKAPKTVPVSRVQRSLLRRLVLDNGFMGRFNSELTSRGKSPNPMIRGKPLRKINF